MYKHMWLIVGLGNPGKEYKTTRHNIGFMMLDSFSSSFKEQKKIQGFISKIRLGEKDILLLKPLTFMNLSGHAIAKTCAYYGIDTQHIIVIHDDSDIVFPHVKIQKGRGSAGHHGVESVMEQLGSKDFLRIRIGIRPQGNTQKSETFVLKPFSPEEMEQLPILSQEIQKKIATLI